ncbi:putative E3 ubiquitin-protein ligase RAD18 [Monocercomonoides exilis]|uniref:putative E3 ubiquitin-protein ligase RAD18 n=1 Tax=Monocercomonoides exilis TaxID=2049356 RepID=UPI003559A290|nr:putative E3 ubiquitin-protein ligase RAD18 [Monocercomonoides exilis]|eukprot:MONOS_7775.1-p1 / transcript=MONOS_7775.1 / gene=MONOS_7775 / organism=Monocercomonoides_exilis_PA203 / gene_product=unspecified product / transcript_product=unspecified product / location=Mono_scaffold00274:60428-63831(+) / protein_length=1023 / sequence_SO=supercontig / SO=protein_coding / is_pseudo=false
MDDIDSSSDWKIESIRKLEDALRCPICGEFMKHSVQLQSCPHSFCGLCIRRSFATRPYCPVCRTHITGNFLSTPTLDTVINLFYEARNDLLKQDESFTNKASPNDLTDEMNKKHRHRTKQTSDSATLDKQEIIALDGTACDPMTRSTPQIISAASNQKDKQVTSLKPLPTTVYALLTTEKIRRLCKTHGLSTKGTREQLIERHKELVLVYNSQLSDPHPMTAFEIAQQLSSNLQPASSPQIQPSLAHSFSHSQTHTHSHSHSHSHQSSFTNLSPASQSSPIVSLAHYFTRSSSISNSCSPFEEAPSPASLSPEVSPPSNYSPLPKRTSSSTSSSTSSFSSSSSSSSTSPVPFSSTQPSKTIKVASPSLPSPSSSFMSENSELGSFHAENISDSIENVAVAEEISIGETKEQKELTTSPSCLDDMHKQNEEEDDCSDSNLMRNEEFEEEKENILFGEQKRKKPLNNHDNEDNAENAISNSSPFKEDKAENNEKKGRKRRSSKKKRKSSGKRKEEEEYDDDNEVNYEDDEIDYAYEDSLEECEEEDEAKIELDEEYLPEHTTKRQSIIETRSQRKKKKKGKKGKKLSNISNSSNAKKGKKVERPKKRVLRGHHAEEEEEEEAEAEAEAEGEGEGEGEASGFELEEESRNEANEMRDANGVNEEAAEDQLELLDAVEEEKRRGKGKNGRGKNERKEEEDEEEGYVDDIKDNYMDETKHRKKRRSRRKGSERSERSKGEEESKEEEKAKEERKSTGEVDWLPEDGFNPLLPLSSFQNLIADLKRRKRLEKQKKSEIKQKTESEQEIVNQQKEEEEKSEETDKVEKVEKDENEEIKQEKQEEKEKDEKQENLRAIDDSSPTSIKETQQKSELPAEIEQSSENASLQIADSMTVPTTPPFSGELRLSNPFSPASPALLPPLSSSSPPSFAFPASSSPIASPPSSPSDTSTRTASPLSFTPPVSQPASPSVSSLSPSTSFTSPSAHATSPQLAIARKYPRTQTRTSLANAYLSLRKRILQSPPRKGEKVG